MALQICTLDFESFYSSTYSLSKLTTEEYVMGDEFEAIGFSINWVLIQPSGSVGPVNTYKISLTGSTGIT